MLILDAHLDLAINAIEWNRDLTLPLSQICESDVPLPGKAGCGRGTVSLPEMRKAGIGLCVATQLARVELNAWSPVNGWRSQAQAWAMTQGQLAWYQAMEEAGEMVQIRTASDLKNQVAIWEQALVRKDGSHLALPIGYVLSLEGADSLLSLDHLHRAYQNGLRAIGPAHYGPGVYANGTDSSGGFNPAGLALLREAGTLGMILDATHLCDDAFWEAMDLYEGPVWASHHNCRSLVPHNRQLSDEMILALAARGAVIGTAFDAWMLVPGWIRGQTTPEAAGVRLSTVVDHMDHICQLTGTARHLGIGSDLNGCFGTEQSPADLTSIADLTRLPELLSVRGYTEADILGIMNGNFVHFLLHALESSVSVPSEAAEPRFTKTAFEAVPATL
jgi:membrane dipeptidase